MLHFFGLRGPVLSRAELSSLLHAMHSPLRTTLMLVDTVLVRAGAELSDAVPTSIWVARSGEWLAYKSELGLSTGLSTGLGTGLGI